MRHNTQDYLRWTCQLFDSISHTHTAKLPPRHSMCYIEPYNDTRVGLIVESDVSISWRSGGLLPLPHWWSIYKLEHYSTVYVEIIYKRTPGDVVYHSSSSEDFLTTRNSDNTIDYLWTLGLQCLAKAVCKLTNLFNISCTDLGKHYRAFT